MPDNWDAEDKRKLHAEINQLLNQRFLLTTAAITIFGAFSSWMIPKDPTQHKEAVVHLLFAGAMLLLIFLAVLFWWNCSLANLQQNLATYLIRKGASCWEADWSKYRALSGSPTTMKVQAWVFVVLGSLTAAWPFGIALALDLPCDRTWAAVELIVAGLYISFIICGGFCRCLRKDESIKKNWGKVLGPETQSDAPSTPASPT